MALQTRGPISAADILAELSQTGQFNMNDPEERALAGKGTAASTISFSDFYGKSSVVTTTFKFKPGYASGLIKRRGIDDQAGYNIGTAVDMFSVMPKKSGGTVPVRLYYYVPEEIQEEGTPDIPGEPGPIITKWQFIRFSIFRTDGTTVGADFDYSRADIRVYLDSTNQGLHFWSRSNPVNGTGVDDSYINLSPGGQGGSGSVQFEAYNIMEIYEGQTLRLEIDWF